MVSTKQIVEENGKAEENETAEENTKENGSAENGTVNGSEEEKVKEVGLSHEKDCYIIPCRSQTPRILTP